MKMSYVLLTCIAIFSFGLYTSWKHIVEWHVVLSHCQFQLEIARVTWQHKFVFGCLRGLPSSLFLRWSCSLVHGLHLCRNWDFTCYSFDGQREDRPLPNCLCERLCSICIYLTNIWYNLQIGHKLQVRKNDVQISSLWVSFFHIPYSSTLRYVTRLTTIRYIISLHDDAKCNNELPAPTGTTVFHFALTSRAIFRFTPLSTLPLRFPWRGCWHLVEGLNLTPSRARCLGHTVE